MTIRAYIAGPYSAPTPEAVERNVWAAIDAWHKLRDAGFVPFCPHLSHYLEARRPRRYEDWMEWDSKWLDACDIVVRIGGASPGAEREVAQAHEAGMAVYSLDEAIRDLGRRS